MSHRQSAFSLVELSFVIAIVALLTVGGLSVGVSVVDQKRHVDTKLQLNEITDALQAYYSVNNALPMRHWPKPMRTLVLPRPAPLARVCMKARYRFVRWA